MNIDLVKLHSNIVDEITLDEVLSFPKEYLENSTIKRLDNIKVIGKIYLDEERSDKALLTVSGDMIIEDSISLDDINYPFFIEIDDYIEEIAKKDENILDLYEFLWENIVLEVPLKYTKVKDLSKFQGDGWKLLDENNNVQDDNPFNDLLKDME